jgi:hypothetical protein
MRPLAMHRCTRQPTLAYSAVRCVDRMRALGSRNARMLGLLTEPYLTALSPTSKRNPLPSLTVVLV